MALTLAYNESFEYTPPGPDALTRAAQYNCYASNGV